MNCRLIYFTKTGHSKKIAEAIAREIGIEAEDIKTKPKLENVDLLLIVGGIYGGASDPETLAYFESIETGKVKKAALITSCVSKVMKQDAIRKSLQGKGVDVIPNEFICQGNFLLFGFGHPDATDIANAVAHAKKLVANEKRDSE
ncbi:MAG: hypothetical protein HGA54_05125 [Actinobacteria bacterium]|nr:hypothetical protein [Actinomycetota bacterium]